MDELMSPTRASLHHDHASTQSSEDGILRPSRMASRRRCRASGFTLLETMVAIAILTVGTLGVAGSMITSMMTTRESRTRTHAIYLAEQQMEIFRLMTGAEINGVLADPSYPNDPAGAIDPDPNDDDPTTYTRSWEILPDDPEAGIFKLTVIVGFTNKLGTPQTERIQSLKADI
jgi:prepilin-type N-terminal cleavage/methylation domain-containing protein